MSWPWLVVAGWLALDAVLVLVLVLAYRREERFYRRERERFQAGMDERAGRSALYPPPRLIQVANEPVSVLNEARPYAVGTEGHATEREFDGLQNSPG